jgi:hypothetical protein
MKVYVIIYTHKHGCDVSVHGTRDGAERSAEDLISNRASESWDKEDLDRLDLAGSFDDRMDFFHAIEREVSYGEAIELEEREVQ